MGIPNPASEDIKDQILLSTDSPMSELEFGKNLFIGREPARPDDCVTIFDTPGFPPDRHYDPETRYYRPSVQIRVRAREYVNAYTMITLIKESLHNLPYIAINDTVYTGIFCSQEPALLDWDENGRCRWVTTFDLQRRPGEGVSWDTYANKTWDKIGRAHV